ncbi:hypothetical protein BDP81DRAFT_179026 [Colletotrichum phormii]|uniref:Uncharacterized protein n=1 Tax=Colletotrichum phormii TaxID=359342 RepID=A0AAI9ZZ73_9PEZI|nr:uncharacterized protein BDP81DRAFT_179026 [Colletotrichum phormii]KAK1639539.1 hypothetical protein BDP81DRAFT_179026 [Colletotrichum phormii]
MQGRSSERHNDGLVFAPRRDVTSIMEMEAPTVEDCMIVAHHLSGNRNRTGREAERHAMGRSLPSGHVFVPLGAMQVRVTCQLAFPPSINAHPEFRIPACNQGLLTHSQRTPNQSFRDCVGFPIWLHESLRMGSLPDGQVLISLAGLETKNRSSGIVAVSSP